VGLILTFVLAFTLYPALASALTDRFGWAPVWSKPLAFVVIWAVGETLISLLGNLLISRLGSHVHYSTTNRVLAVLPGAVQGLIFAAVILTVLALAPLQGYRQQIIAGPISGRLVQTTLALERPLEGIFGPAARQTLGFITVPSFSQPQEGESEGMKLNFTVEDPTTEPETEDGMLALVNRERTQRGLTPLQMDPELRLLARAHAADMFNRGYFAHDTPEGKNPFDRMREANIIFGAAGENLALAPTLDMAHDGLMNSPGHRANILNSQFRKVGIGVLDGGIYGKMFVQEFTD
jgi:uncharacterized protein YkwD